MHVFLQARCGVIAFKINLGLGCNFYEEFVHLECTIRAKRPYLTKKHYLMAYGFASYYCTHLFKLVKRLMDICVNVSG